MLMPMLSSTIISTVCFTTACGPSSLPVLCLREREHEKSGVVRLQQRGGEDSARERAEAGASPHVAHRHRWSWGTFKVKEGWLFGLGL